MGTSAPQLMQRPKRWDAPFDASMSESDVDELLARPEFAALDASRFPAAAPLRGILKNDCRIVAYDPGDIIVREGDYGNSAFRVLSGTARVVLPPGLPQRLLGRAAEKKKSLLEAVREVLRRPALPEVRDTSLYGRAGAHLRADGERRSSLLDVAERAV